MKEAVEELAEAGQFPEGEAKVSAAPLAHLLDMVFGRIAADQLLRVLRLERGTFDFVQDTVQPDHRGHAHSYMEVCRTFGDH